MCITTRAVLTEWTSLICFGLGWHMQAPVADKYIVPTEAPVALDMADVNSSTIKITLKAGHLDLRPALGVDGKSLWKKTSEPKRRCSSLGCHTALPQHCLGEVNVSNGRL